MSTAVMFSSRKCRRMAMALHPQQLSSSMVTPGANRGRVGHRQHLRRGGVAGAQGQGSLMEHLSPLIVSNLLMRPHTLPHLLAKSPGQFPAQPLGLLTTCDPGGLSQPQSPPPHTRLYLFQQAASSTHPLTEAQRSALDASPLWLHWLLQDPIQS